MAGSHPDIYVTMGWNRLLDLSYYFFHLHQGHGIAIASFASLLQCH